MFDQTFFIQVYVSGTPELMLVFEAIGGHVTRINDHTISLDGVIMSFAPHLYVDFRADSLG